MISPIHLWRLLAETGLSFQRTRSWKASPDPDYETRAARVLELYAAAPFEGPVISFDQMGPISLKPIQGAGWAKRKRPERLRATYDRKHGIRYIFGALDVHRDRLYARMRPRRAGSDVLGYLRTTRAVYPARQKIHWILDNLSANWTPEIRAYAAAQQDRADPDPDLASYLNRIESHFRPIQEFVFSNTDYPDWPSAQRALPTTSPTATAATTTDGSPPWNANTESQHDAAISGQTFGSDPLGQEREGPDPDPVGRDRDDAASLERLLEPRQVGPE